MEINKETIAGEEIILSGQKIVSSQTVISFQRPEPWSGRLDIAPILFLSSNPSIDEEETYPDAPWEAERITDFFQNRFSSPAGWVDSRLCALKRDGTRTDWVRYWAAARARTSEILGKPKTEVKPGILSRQSNSGWIR